ncbi:hypothetical protein [Novosphingopyxis sp.]|uniref:hypothetical protein n=1 Tax=Novosphingopyxis sp. TaxID=2709690 RepID=UPI003B5996D5
MQEARIGEERQVDGIGQAHVGQIGLRFAAAFGCAIDLGMVTTIALVARAELTFMGIAPATC